MRPRPPRIRGPVANDQGRRIRTHPSDDTNYNLEPLLFSLYYTLDGYCLEQCEQEARAAFADAMWRRRHLTWVEVQRAPRHGLGTEKIDRASIKVNIPDRITEDVTLLVMRFHGTRPMVGFRDRQIFHIIWFDHNYSVYDHGP